MKVHSPHRRLQPGLAVLVDAALINLAFLTAYYIRYDLQWFRPLSDLAFDAPYSAYVPFAVGLTLLCLSAFGLGGVYQSKRGLSWLEEMYPIVNGTTSAIMVLVVITFGVRPLAFSRLIFFYAAVLVAVYLGVARVTRRALEARLRARGVNVTHALIVGAGEVGRAVMRQMVARPELGYRIVGFLDDDPAKRTDLGRIKALGWLGKLERVLRAEHVDEVIIALPWMDPRKIMQLVHTSEVAGVAARIVPDLFQLSLSRVDVANLGGIPLIGIKEVNISQSGRFLKRALDLSLSGFALLLTAPLFLLIALLIRLDSPGPVFFTQTRVGELGRPFKIYKFRSMRDGAEEEQPALRERNEASGPLFKIRNDPRVTRVGRWLRRMSLDELPQLINVLRGEMSLVGPRPGPPSEVERYEAWQRTRLDVAPGMSGLWQVSGRSDISFEEMCLMDIYYIENWSLGLDLSIMLRTLPTVLGRDGAY